MDPIEITTKLQKMEIDPKKIERLIQIGQGKSAQTWQELFGNLELLPKLEQNRVIDIILEKASSPQKKVILPIVKGSLAERAERTIESLKTLVCLGQIDETRKVTDEWDSLTGCSGKPVYVCHHCKNNVCSTHSYWIPDSEFPFLLRKPKVEEDRRKKLVLIMIGVFMFAIGLMLTIMGAQNRYYLIEELIAVGVIFMILGVMLIVFAILMKDKKSNVYPEITKTVKTKWGNLVEIVYQHLGFYSAVHCWQCLKTYHSDFVESGKTVYGKMYNRTSNWKKKLTTGSIPLTEPERYGIANYAANLFLSDFKFALTSLYPIQGRFRELKRPVEYNDVYREGNNNKTIEYHMKKWRKQENIVLRYYLPTPIWLLTPVQKKNVEYIELDKWLEKYEQYIKINNNIAK